MLRHTPISHEFTVAMKGLSNFPPLEGSMVQCNVNRQIHEISIHTAICDRLAEMSDKIPTITDKKIHKYLPVWRKEGYRGELEVSE